MNFPTYALGNLPEGVLAQEPIISFCPVCYAMVPQALEQAHVEAAHKGDEAE